MLNCTNLFFQIARSKRDLVLFHPSRVPRPLRRQVVLPAPRPVFVVFEVVGHELLPGLLDDRLRLEVLIWKRPCSWIEVATARGHRERFRKNCILDVSILCRELSSRVVWVGLTKLPGSCHWVFLFWFRFISLDWINIIFGSKIFTKETGAIWLVQL